MGCKQDNETRAAHADGRINTIPRAALITAIALVMC